MVLTPGFPPGKEREYFSDTANSQQAPNYFGARTSYANDHRQNAYGLKIKSHGSPISPLSPQDSSHAASDNGQRMSGGWNSASYQSESSSHSDTSLEGHVKQEEADYYGRQYGHIEQSEGSLAYHNSPSSVLKPMPYPGAIAQGYSMPNYQQDGRHVPDGQYAQSQSNCAQRNPEMVHMLQVLENALLDDDDDDDHRAPEGNWADTIEKFLAADNSAIKPSPVTSRTTQPDYGKQQCNENAINFTGAVTARVEELALQKLVVATRSRSEQLLVACAEAVSNNDMPLANVLIAQLNQEVSIHGDPMQRLAAYMVEGLVARVAASGKSIYTSLKCKEPPTRDLLSAMQILYEVCPYFKFGYMAANGAIAEAFQNESRVHIIDFQIAQGTQWTTLIRALAARPGGPPHVRITGIDDPMPGPTDRKSVV